MARPTIPAATILAIQTAPPTEPVSSLAARLGVSERTVLRYRAQAREQRREAARETVAEHVHEHLPGALADLTELRGLVAARYRGDKGAEDGRLWLSTILATLDRLGAGPGEEDPLAGVDDRALVEELVERRRRDGPGGGADGPDRAQPGAAAPA